MDFLQNTIKELENEDTLKEIKNLFQNLDDEILIEEFSEFELDIDNIRDCSISFSYLDFPTAMGTNFLSIYNPLQAVNAILPDLFRVCGIITPDKFAHPVFRTRICAKIALKFVRDYVSTASFSRFQRIIPSEIIKSFFYFGYKSDFTKMDISSVDFLEKKIESIVEKSQSNYSNFTNPETIYNELYDKDTILNALLSFNDKLNEVKQEKTDSTNLNYYNLNYLFSFYAIVILRDGLPPADTFYSNFNDKNTSSLSYSDLVYLNYLRALLSDDINLETFLNILDSKIIDTELNPEALTRLRKVINHIKENNIFTIIDNALEVKQYILNVISYTLNKKVYNLAEYAKPKYLGLTKSLYCNYCKNSNFNYPELEVPQSCL